MCLCLVDSYKLRRPLACFLGLPRTLPLITSVLSVWIVKISNFPVCEIFENQVLDTFYTSTGCSASCSAGASTMNCGWCLLCSGGALVADVLPWSVVRPKLAQMLVLDVPLFCETGVFPFWAHDRVPGSWYGSGSVCVMNNACSAEDSGVLKASSSSLSSFRTFLLGLRRLGPVRVSSPSSL